MYIVEIIYSDGSNELLEHILSANHYNAAGLVTVSSNEMLEHRFPIGRDIQFLGENENHMVSGKNVKLITVTKES